MILSLVTSKIPSYPEYWIRQSGINSGRSTVWDFQLVHRVSDKEGRVVTVYSDIPSRRWNTQVPLAYYIVSQVTPINISEEQFNMMWNLADTYEIPT